MRHLGGLAHPAHRQRAATRSSTSLGIASACSVAIIPGSTALAVMPWRAPSVASVRTIPSSPAFDAAYATWPGSPPVAAPDEIATIRPYAALAHARQARLHRRGTRRSG